MDEYRKYYNETRALKYQQRKPEKHAAELRLVDRAFSFIPHNHRVLDVPCGGGRLLIHVGGQNYKVEGADVSPSMIEIAKKNAAENNLACPIQCEDLERLSYHDGSFDTVVCFRLFHHFPNSEIRRRTVKELCRVATCNVALSYFTPWSFTSLRRNLRAACGGKNEQVHATSLREIEDYFESEGFRLVKDFAQTPLLHTLHLALFTRSSLS